MTTSGATPAPDASSEASSHASSGTGSGTASGAVSDYATYIAGLPRVLAAAATVFRDEGGRVLIVEPNYREGWTLPGGTVEADTGETPRQAARRETAEEIGLDLTPGPLLAVDWVHGAARPPLVAYVYDGGVLTKERFAAIRLQEEELDSWKLVGRAELAGYLPGPLCLRVHAALDALAAGRGPVELEDGRVAR
ncbi:NUDIX domain-containing protein [Streptomyces sp. NPDC048718]|uniref:NUDIX domain-containing protein n=1 Tax=Streptomyces sp. NPDC048718 TaxID=3365587 RepID=UPI00371F6E77